MMLEIYSRNRVKQAILQNAADITETLRINEIYSLAFSLPYDDAKNEYCTPFSLAKWNGRLYRIQPSALEISDTGMITYTCEHVIATLIDKVLFGYHHLGGLGVYTADVIRSILSRQSDWKLGECAFSRQFEYGWEQESLLSALFSIPNRFTELYMWDYNTDIYPWTLHLRKIDTSANPTLYIRNEKNLLNLSRQSDTTQICTRLYPLGYGEGVNQLNIKGVNSGIPYLQSPKAYTDKYGIVERVWIDRRYEDAESLKQAAQAMLTELQEPYEEYSVGLAELGGGSYDEADVGKIVQITDNRVGLRKKSYVTEIQRVNNDIAESTVTVANKSRSIASTVADLADRQRIEAAYSQGATQVYSLTLQANADASNGAVLDFFIPSEMRIINKVLIKVRMGSFRAYSKATESGGSVTTGTSSSSVSSVGGGSTTTGTSSSSVSSVSGGSTQTSSAGGSTTVSGGSKQTSSSGGSTSVSGGSTKTSSSSGSTNVSGGSTSTGTSTRTFKSIGTGGPKADPQDKDDHYHLIESSVLGHSHTVNTSHSHSIGNHTHTIDTSHSHKIGSHTHTVDTNHSHSIGNHTHSVSTSHSHNISHTHTVNTSHSHNISHTHTVDTRHTHNITAGIYRFGNPKSFRLFVNGQQKATINATGSELDITSHLLSNGTIPRGSWMSVEIRPDSLAYISAVLFVQGFVQSRGDMTV